MGNTYHNITVKGPTQIQIVTYLEAQGQAAFVSPTLADITFVYSPDASWSALAEDLSRTFHCPALFVSGYDNDVFQYTLHAAGRIIDEYDSAPDFFDNEVWWGTEEEPEGVRSHQPEPAGGDAHLLCTTLDIEHAVEQVEAILHPPVPGSIRTSGLGAFHQHWALAEVLGWPPSASVTDYARLEHSTDGSMRDLEQEFGGVPLIRVPGR